MMSAMRDLAELEIRTFGSFEEVEALERFELNAPLSPANYKRLYGDYHVLEKVRCCVQKENGKLCEEPHNHGWLAERVDGKLTLVGGDCAMKKFGADRRLATDLGHYRNEKNRKARIASLAEAIAAKHRRLDALSKIQADVKVLESRVRSITGQLGPLTIRRIQDMIRTRTFDVVVVATRRRTETDSKGNKKHEDRSFPYRLGALSALELATTGAFNTVYEGVNDIVRAYEVAGALIKESDLRRKSKLVETTSGRLQRYDPLIAEGQRLLALERVFFENDFTLFCFLSSDKNERNKAARLAMMRSGRSGEKIEPGEWLARHETYLKDKLQVRDVSIR